MQASTSEPSTPAPPLSSVVFRLSQRSRHHTLASAHLLRDYFQIAPLPPLNKPAVVTVLLSELHLILLSVVGLHTPRLLASTAVYLLPPIPTCLTSSAITPAPRSAFVEPTFFDLLNNSVASSPLLSHLQIPSPSSYLLYAQHGAGKSSFVANVAHIQNLNLVRLCPTDLLAWNTSKQALQHSLVHYFEAALSCQPSLLLIDDAHLLFPPTDPHAAEAAVALIHRLRIARADSNLVSLVFAAAPHSDAVHNHLPANVDHTLPLGLHPAGPWACSLASQRYGLTQQDLQVLFARKNIETITQTLAIARAMNRESAEEQQQQISKQRVIVQWSNLSSQFGGNQKAQKALKRLLLYPRTKANALRKLNVTTVKGVLLYGPPGTGKTMLLRHAADASNYKVLPLDAASLSRSEVGESEKRLRKAFERAENLAPCVIFLDEIDAMFSSKGSSRLSSVLSACFDNLNKAVVVATTNKPQMISKNLLRADRLEYLVKVPLPNQEERAQIAHVYAEKMELEGEVKNALLRVAEQAARFSGADIAGACRRAATSALRSSRDIGVEDIEHSFKTMVASVSIKDEVDINSWNTCQ